MGVELAEAYIALLPETSKIAPGVRKAFGEVERDANASGKRSGKAMGGSAAAGIAGVAARIAAPVAAAFAAINVGDLLIDSINKASDLAESGTKIAQIFGKEGAKAVDEFASKGAKSLGLSKNAALDAIATFGVFGKSAGKTGRDLAGFSSNMSSLAVDLASFHNTSPEEAVEALSAALRGESEPMRRYGALLDDATLRQEAMRLGLIKNTKTALTPQQKVLAAQAAIMKQTADAQGDFAKTSGGLANQQRILAAQFEDGKTKLGELFLPAATGVTTWLNDTLLPALSGVVPFLGKVFDGFQGITDILVKGDYTGALSKAFGWEEDSAQVDFLFGIRDALQGIGTALQGEGAKELERWQGAFQAIVGDGKGFTDWVQNGLGPAVGDFAGALQDAWNVVAPIVDGIRDQLFKTVEENGPKFQAMFGSMQNIVTRALGIITTRVQQFTAVLKPLWDAIGPYVLDILGALWGAVIGIVEGAWKILEGIFDVMFGVIAGDWGAVWEGLGKVVEGAWKIIWSIIESQLKIVDSILENLGWKKPLEDFGRWLGTTFRDAVNAISGFFTGPVADAGTGVQTGIADIQGFFQGIWDWISGTFSGLWSGIVDIFGPPLDNVRKIIEVFAAVGKIGLEALWTWVSGVFSDAWDGLVDIFGPPLTAVGDFIGDTIDGWKSTIGGIWTWISTKFAEGWNTLYGDNGIITKPVRLAKEYVGARIDDIRKGIDGAWTWARDTFSKNWAGLQTIITTPVRLAKDAILGKGGLLDLLKTGFSTAIDGIGKAWDGLKGALSTPVKWAADNVVNPLIRNFNTVADKVGMGKTHHINEWVFNGLRSGGYTGNVGVDQPAGVVHGREWVMDAETTRKAGGPTAMERLRKAIRRGDLEVPGYRAGGWVAPVRAGNSGWNGGRYRSGKWHGGLDYPVPTGTPVVAPTTAKVLAKRYLTRSYGIHAILGSPEGYKIILAHLSNLPSLPGAGSVIPRGQTVGFSGSTGNSTGPHLHLEVIPPGGSHTTAINPLSLIGGLAPDLGKSMTHGVDGGWFGGFPGPVEWLASLMSGPLDKAKLVPGGMWGDVVAGLPKQLAGGMTAKIKEAFAFDSGGYLQPGYTLAYNGTGNPEPVFTSDQWDDLGGGSGGPVEAVFYDTDGVLVGTIRGEIQRSVSGVKRRVRQTARSGGVES